MNIVPPEIVSLVIQFNPDVDLYKVNKRWNLAYNRVKSFIKAFDYYYDTDSLNYIDKNIISLTKSGNNIDVEYYTDLARNTRTISTQFNINDALVSDNLELFEQIKDNQELEYTDELLLRSFINDATVIYEHIYEKITYVPKLLIKYAIDSNNPQVLWWALTKKVQPGIILDASYDVKRHANDEIYELTEALDLEITKANKPPQQFIVGPMDICSSFMNGAVKLGIADFLDYRSILFIYATQPNFKIFSKYSLNTIKTMINLEIEHKDGRILNAMIISCMEYNFINELDILSSRHYILFPYNILQAIHDNNIYIKKPLMKWILDNYKLSKQEINTILQNRKIRNLSSVICIKKFY